MLLGNINYPETYKPFLKGEMWPTIIDWLKSNQSLAEVEYEIDGRNIYASISTVATKPRQDCIFEAHREHIDVHFCIEGGELIEWAPVENLKPTMEFDSQKDYGLYEAPTTATSLVLIPGTLAIFFSADAHMPKISDNKNEQIKKVVVKIKVALLQ